MRKFLYILFATVLLAGCAKVGTRTAATPPGEAKGADTALIERVYFSFDSDLILTEASQSIDHNINWMNQNSGDYIILEGHCDEVGPSDYNMELGDRRARAVKAYIIEHDIPHERIIMIVSYGATKPLNPGHRIEDLRENRRVEFVIR